MMKCFLFYFFFFSCLLDARRPRRPPPSETLTLHQLISSKKDIEVISLGSHCQASMMIRGLDMRNFATPLEWLLSLNHRGVIDLINNDFSEMLNEELLLQYYEGYVINTKYDLDFRHDWSSGHDLLTDLPKIREKYRRRVERFLFLPQIAHRVVFLRVAFDDKLNVLNNIPTYSKKSTKISYNEAKELYLCLKRKFPNLKFLLVVVNFKDKIKPFPVHKNILEYQVMNSIYESKRFVELLGNVEFFENNYRK